MNNRRAAVAMFCILLFSYVINAMDRQLFSVLASDVRKALELTVPQTGLASTVFTLGMGLAGLPTGYLLGKMTRKNVVLIGILIFSAATCLTAYARNLDQLLAYRFVSGLGEAMQLTALLAIATTYFSHHQALAASSLNFTFGLGAIIGPNLGAALLGSMGWQFPFLAFGWSGVLAMVLIVLLVKPWLTETQALDQQTQLAGEEQLPTTLMARTPLLLALATVFAGLSIYGYLGLYPTYLREALGFAPKDAALAISMYGLGALVSLLGGWLGDRYDYRKLLGLALCGAAGIGALLFSNEQASLALHALLSFLFGASISGIAYANLSAGIIRSVRRSCAARASGLFVAALYIPAAFSGYLLGLLKVSLGWDMAGLLQISGCALLAALLALLARTPSKLKTQALEGE
ncbi:MFS transporter [Herbaspirillum rubrisubalbicans]|uniref:MFS transporter n=2 Tax=Herbaspirillum rubrisubalbicans TaxID=80842 RepID=A0ABX9BUL2_9BURK|nr:MFS transporter [Herbaspirillum rubrisubalbicans]RAN46654.1 MFS transporter [Herbaspirillum rubrisubalbicans]